jgi:two-component system, sensor histidine kinase
MERHMNPSYEQNIGLFIGMLAHEVRTPLQTILNHTAILESQGQSDDSLKSINAVKRQATLLDEMFKSMYLYLGITKNDLTERVQITKISEILDYAKEACELSSTRKRITVLLPNEIGCKIECVPELITQTVINILSNAIKFSPKDSIITIKERCDSECSMISIKDNGIGIEKEKLSRIFILFHQEKPSVDNGLGIGLYLSDLFVRIHGGSIKVISDGMNSGTEFIITIPNRKKNHTLSLG